MKQLNLHISVHRVSPPLFLGETNPCGCTQSPANHVHWVLHPQSMRPAREADIPVRVKNFCNPNAPGTLITRVRDMSKHSVEAECHCAGYNEHSSSWSARFL
ncbi:uncharacterized protein LOC131239317 [Magnolia sinica]|uniref:uncharacterized protein LOC131239317 n=1 Tax=Magnolia sinica TaxID=86752 RepID=UPI002658C848|nr:uncharacterized protein LOC131239317 [Magnolia sinica]